MKTNVAAYVLIGCFAALGLALTTDQIIANVYDSGTSAMKVKVVSGGAPAASITSGTTTITSGVNKSVCFDDSGVFNCGSGTFQWDKAVDQLLVTHDDDATPQPQLIVRNHFQGAGVLAEDSGGTTAAPVRLGTGDNAGGYFGGGYDGTSWSSTQTPFYTWGLFGTATENWTATAHGTSFGFYVTPNTTTTPVLAGYWDQDKSLKVVGVLKAGSGPTTITDAAGKVLSAALNTVGVAQGGTGLTTLTSNVIYKGNGASAPAVSSITDDGTTVTTTEALSIGGITINGALKYGSTAAVAVSSSGNIAATTRVEDCTSAASAITRTLPLATGSHRVVSLFKVDAGAGTCIFGRTGSDAINGGTTRTLSAQFKADHCIDQASALWICQGDGT